MNVHILKVSHQVKSVVRRILGYQAWNSDPDQLQLIKDRHVIFDIGANVGVTMCSRKFISSPTSMPLFSELDATLKHKGFTMCNLDSLTAACEGYLLFGDALIGALKLGLPSGKNHRNQSRCPSRRKLRRRHGPFARPNTGEWCI